MVPRVKPSLYLNGKPTRLSDQGPDAQRRQLNGNPSCQLKPYEILAVSLTASSLSKTVLQSSLDGVQSCEELAYECERVDLKFV